MSLETAKTTAKSFFRKFLIIGFLALILFSTVYYFYRTYTISEGTRTGILYKISKKGAMFKTFEGELQLAGSAIVNKASSWSFSVKNQNVYSSVQNLEGKNVRLYYQEMVHSFPWQGETNYLVYKAEEVK